MPRPLTPAEREALDSFIRTMRDEVIPQIVEDVMKRERLARESRRGILT